MDMQAALGIHQLRRLDGVIERRREIARNYAARFADLPELLLPDERPGRKHSYHLYPVRVNRESGRLDRDLFISELRKARVGTSLHFVPLHRQPYYRSRYGYQNDSFPVAEKLYSELVSLPLYPKMSDGDVRDVISAVRAIVLASRKTGYRYPAAS
jgi:dTDP-4-amino-4,6-dideoxygalactose transaminase